MVVVDRILLDECVNVVVVVVGYVLIEIVFVVFVVM